MGLISRMMDLCRALADQGWALLLALALQAVSSQAGASMVLVSNTSLVSGSQSSVFSFEAPGNGTVTAQLSNLAWPTSLNSLTLAATTSNQVLGQISPSAFAAAATAAGGHATHGPAAANCSGNGSGQAGK